jgi:hypothetical protein
MHFEILVEDQSGKKALDILIPKLVGDEHTFNVHSYICDKICMNY